MRVFHICMFMSEDGLCSPSLINMRQPHTILTFVERVTVKFLFRRCVYHDRTMGTLNVIVGASAR